MTDLITSIFATHHLNWADVQALLNILLTVDERELVINKANEEAHHLHQEHFRQDRAHSGWYAHRLHQENFNETPNQLGQFSLESPTGA